MLLQKKKPKIKFAKARSEFAFFLEKKGTKSPSPYKEGN
jgi:hypothetical protein